MAKVPAKLGIIFKPDLYDAWRHLGQRRLYTPAEGTTQKSNVLSLGLTGNLTSGGPIGIYWNHDSAILVMDGKAVQARNDLTPVLYTNVDQLAAGNLRLLRRIAEEVGFMELYRYVLLGVLALSDDRLRRVLTETKKNAPGSAKLSVSVMGKISRNTFLPGLDELDKRNFGERIIQRTRFNTANELGTVLRREGPAFFESKLAKSTPDGVKVLFWKADIDKNGVLVGLTADPNPIPGGNELTMGEFRAGLQRYKALAAAGQPLFQETLVDWITQEAKGFFVEEEWVVNPMPDPSRKERVRALGYSVFLNIPPNSVVYCVDRDPTAMRNLPKTFPASYMGLWLVGIPNDMDQFEVIEANVGESIREYLSGDAGLDYVYAIARKHNATVLPPNDYWTVHQDK